MTVGISIMQTVVLDVESVAKINQASLLGTLWMFSLWRAHMSTNISSDL